MASFTFIGPGGASPEDDIARLRAAAQPQTSDVMYALERQKTRILSRNQSGTDFSGSPFAQYSDSYAAYRQRKGRNQNPVDLTFSGMMNKAILATINGAAGTGGTDPVTGVFALGFYGEESVRAEAHNEGALVRTRLGTGKGKAKKGGKAAAVLPQRRFFDASPADLEAMQTDIGDRMAARIR